MIKTSQISKDDHEILQTSAITFALFTIIAVIAAPFTSWWVPVVVVGFQISVVIIFTIVNLIICQNVKLAVMKSLGQISKLLDIFTYIPT